MHMKKVSLFVFSTIAAFTMLLAPATVYAANPVDVFTQSCKTNPDGVGCSGGKPATGDGLFGIIKNVIQVLLIIGGIIAVVMIILGGIRYTTSNGEQAHVKQAKDTILYAIVGLVVSIAAFAIVTWVLGNIT